MTSVITHDRGLGSAYERHHFYRLLPRWAEQLGVESVLEGPLDGMAGVPGVHGVGLARSGIPVLSVVRTEAQASITRDVYERAGATSFEVRALEGALDVDDFAPVRALPAHDLVIAYHALEMPNWREYIRALGRLARKALIITTCNPDNWGLGFVRALGVVRGVRVPRPPESWHLEAMAPELWQIGRVREHTYFDAPWWPDLPVAAGQSLVDRTKRLWTGKASDMSRRFDPKDVVLAERFVFGAERWPYFGGPGWADELAPALDRHPSFDGRSGRVAALTAHLHAYVVDTRPRTPQERRRLEQAPRQNGPVASR
jgi:hypothetical protein